MPDGPDQVPNYGAKDLGRYQDLGRGPSTSYFRRIAAQMGLPPTAGTFERLAAFTSNPANWAAWAGHVMRYIGSAKHPFQTYQHNAGIYQFEEKLTLSVAGDWGTGTDEAQLVMKQMMKYEPDYTIHLGDVYYVGDRPELEVNCLGADSARHKGVKWLSGTKGSFALNGNHEMYACGTAYFDHFLTTLGLIDSRTGSATGQGASFFCLRNKYWKIIGLDTGYNSTGVRAIFSFLSRIKALQWFRKTAWFKPSCKLPDELLGWLGNVLQPASDENAAVGPDDGSPGIILLSHHEYYSSFDDWYPTPARQLRSLVNPEKPVLWFWGHEHRFALYDCFGVQDGIRAFGRCVGHGGMPVERNARPDITECTCVLYDDRSYPNNEGIDVGYNGFINLIFDGPTLQVNYYDLYDTLLLTETWATDGKGNLYGPKFSDVSPGLCQPDHAYIKAHS